MTVTVTPIYAALCTLILLVLSWRVIAYRRTNQISVGDKGDKNLLKRMRAQANCAEYTPIGVLLLLLMELAGAPSVALHLSGLVLLAGRLLHAIGFAATPQKLVLRQLGMVLTLTMLGLTSLGLLVHALI